jgi:Domain of unknown function (DUF1816)
LHLQFKDSSPVGFPLSQAAATIDSRGTLIMEDSQKPEFNPSKLHFLERLNQLFCSQMDSIILAIDLLKYSDYFWTDEEYKYLELLKKSAIKMIKIIENRTSTANCEVSDSLAWWVKVTTAKPDMTYYFGPFTSARDAGLAQPQYIDDFEQAGANILGISIQQCQPSSLTIVEPESKPNCKKISHSFYPDLN